MKVTSSVGKTAATMAAVMVLVTMIFIPAMEARAAEAYKVGAVFSVTGRASFLGDPEKKTAEMVVEQINQAGGINGKNLKLIVYDDEGDAIQIAGKDRPGQEVGDKPQSREPGNDVQNTGHQAQQHHKGQIAFRIAARQWPETCRNNNTGRCVGAGHELA